MLLCTEVSALLSERAAIDPSATVGFVPTMGYLHEGHVSLMRAAAERCDVAVASIYINPTQFGEGEDLDRYPRDLDGDNAKCRDAGIALLFAPTDDEMYANDHTTVVSVGEVTDRFCGAGRPGHFDGVATIVTKLFNLVRPTHAFFGEKDFQQLVTVRRLTRDLNLGVEVVGVPTAREGDGLAMSSRNAYLSRDERKLAPAIYRGLTRMAEGVAEGETDVKALCEYFYAEVDDPTYRVEYLAVVDPNNLEPLSRVDRPARVLTACHLGTTRLIDNLALTPPGDARESSE